MPKSDTLLKAGDKAPHFTLSMADGQMTSLSDMLKNSNVLLLFFRGTWCPNCRKQLISLNTHAEEFSNASTQLVGIFCQKDEPVKKWASSNNIKIPLLIDEDRVVAKTYGVYVRIAWDSFNIARPANFLVDRSGHIRFVYVSSSQWDRCDVDALLAQAKNL